MAVSIAENLGVVGILAVELFLTKQGELIVNELAPRPHNSGHWSIDGAETSQFEQHVRAVCGLPLGPARARNPTVMVNILGEARHGRKMGHFTVQGSDVEAVLARARQLKARL